VTLIVIIIVVTVVNIVGPRWLRYSWCVHRTAFIRFVVLYEAITSRRLFTQKMPMKVVLKESNSLK
jgi:hypothetical protein